MCHIHKEHILFRHLLGKTWTDHLSCHLSQLLPNDNYIPTSHNRHPPRLTQLLRCERPGATHNSVHIRPTTYTYTKSVHFKSTLQHNENMIGHRVAVPPPVITQQYSSATFVSFSFHSRDENFNVGLQKYYYFTSLTFSLSCVKSNIA